MSYIRNLSEKLNKTRVALQSKKISLRKLEDLNLQTRKAFDSAIESLLRKKDFFNEIKKQNNRLRKWRISILDTIFPINIKHVVSAPFIYGMIVPAVFFHVCLEIYHQVCFRLYGIPLVQDKNYFIYDRHLLPYLNWIEKIDCFYCSYMNNLIRYAAEISGRTERFWCPIKHAKRIEQAHSQYDKFVDYLDAKSFREKWMDLRKFNEFNKENENKKCDFNNSEHEKKS